MAKKPPDQADILAASGLLKYDAPEVAEFLYDLAAGYWTLSPEPRHPVYQAERAAADIEAAKMVAALARNGESPEAGLSEPAGETG